jgi:osmotically-inducible protein OsmY
MLNRWVVVLTGFVVLAGLRVAPVAAQAAATPADARVEALVEAALADEQVRGVSVDVRQGVVTLSGTVSNLRTRDKAVRLAKWAARTQQIVSGITVARTESDAVVAGRAASVLHQSELYTIFDEVEAVVRDGTLTLSGRVTEPLKIDEFEWLASGVDGVQEVRCLIEPLPDSLEDDWLRVRLARAIYRDPALSSYSLEPDPPIHIIVERGRVTLVGAVASDMDRRAAEDIVRGTPGVQWVDNELLVMVAAH